MSIVEACAREWIRVPLVGHISYEVEVKRRAIWNIISLLGLQTEFEETLQTMGATL